MWVDTNFIRIGRADQELYLFFVFMKANAI